MPHTLSKSDYKAAHTCPTTLFYRKSRYPSQQDDNPYIALLARGGYMVGKMAQLLYPDGLLLSHDGTIEDSVRATADALRAESVTLFKPTFLSSGRLARLDILEKRDDVLNIIEVKAKSYSSREANERTAGGLPNAFRGKRGGIHSDWRKHLDDVTFQTLVLRELFPNSIVRPHLALVDRDKTTSAEALHQHFQVHRRLTTTGHVNIEVDFTGDADQLRADHPLVIVEVTAEVAELIDSVKLESATYVDGLQPALRKIPTSISVDCRDCDYRIGAGREPNGFRECWGPLADTQPSVLELYQVGTLGGRDAPVANQLIRDGKCSLYDVTPSMLVKKDGAVGAYNRRQLIQLEHTKAGTTWLSSELAAYVGTPIYPLHFIDFETSALVVPYHAGMHPYENVAFQWSCHTVSAPGAVPEHHEWINTVDYFPNVEFARTLRNYLGDDGSVFMWSTHERTVLQGIIDQMHRYGTFDQTLADWITPTADRLIDLNEKTLKGFFHPGMAGRTSIKWVLAAVWETDAELRRQFPRYEHYEGNRLLDPYEALPPIEIAGSRISVSEGTEAIIAYQEMLYGESRTDPTARAAYRQILLQYCELDTAAMYMIWNHWTRLAEQRHRIMTGNT